MTRSAGRSPGVGFAPKLVELTDDVPFEDMWNPTEPAGPRP
jgi:hypothetical protein